MINYGYSYNHYIIIDKKKLTISKIKFNKKEILESFKEEKYFGRKVFSMEF